MSQSIQTLDHYYNNEKEFKIHVGWLYFNGSKVLLKLGEPNPVSQHPNLGRVVLEKRKLKGIGIGGIVFYNQDYYKFTTSKYSLSLMKENLTPTDLERIFQQSSSFNDKVSLQILLTTNKRNQPFVWYQPLQKNLNNSIELKIKNYKDINAVYIVPINSFRIRELESEIIEEKPEIKTALELLISEQ